MQRDLAWLWEGCPEAVFCCVRTLSPPWWRKTGSEELTPPECPAQTQPTTWRSLLLCGIGTTCRTTATTGQRSVSGRSTSAPCCCLFFLLVFPTWIRHYHTTPTQTSLKNRSWHPTGDYWNGHTPLSSRSHGINRKDSNTSFIRTERALHRLVVSFFVTPQTIFCPPREQTLRCVPRDRFSPCAFGVPVLIRRRRKLPG